MTAREGVAPAQSAPRGFDWGAAAGGLLSVALLGAIAFQFRSASADALAMLPTIPLAAWAVFGLLYLLQPVSDWITFHRLWGLRPAGIGALLRKTVINEIVFGYSGEAYLYLWARRHPALADAPFDAIKDVNILSALMGNLLALAMLIASAPELRHVDFMRQLAPALWAGVAVLAISFVVVALARHVLSLGRRDLAFVAAVQALRVTALAALTLILWSLALPQVPLGAWVVLLTIRLLLARVPFVTNKELLFGNLVLLLVGPHAPAAVLLATLAIATLAAHLTSIVAVGVWDVLRRHPRR